MRERWITADLHLGHANISRYSGRPFSNPDDMDEAIVEGWNTTVGPTYWVLIPGDVALGKISDSLADPHTPTWAQNPSGRQSRSLCRIPWQESGWLGGAPSETKAASWKFTRG